MTGHVLLWLADKVTRTLLLLAVLAGFGLYTTWVEGWA